MNNNRKREIIANISEGRPPLAETPETNEADFNYLLRYQMNKSLITGLVMQLESTLIKAKELAYELEKASRNF